MKYIIKYVIIGVLIFQYSCNSHKPTVNELNAKQSNYLTTYDASQRGSFLSIQKEGKMKILSEVQPDVALSNFIDVTNKIDSEAKITAEQAVKITENLTALGKRTAAVNILRDALYRMEEHCINTPEHCTSSYYWNMYNNVIEAVKEIQITEQKAIEAESLKNEVILKELSIEETKMLNITTP